MLAFSLCTGKTQICTYFVRVRGIVTPLSYLSYLSISFCH
ncbi:hypothetical protein ykris0001_11740 [Yersinia kristensenii ATCC 33638]|nr:hypothetical protein ykris0001_11740 [Yersinia kristensenii ATCC 33638]